MIDIENRGSCRILCSSFLVFVLLSMCMSLTFAQFGHYGPKPYTYEQVNKVFHKLEIDPTQVKPTKPTPGNMFSWLNLKNAVRFHLWTRKNPRLAQELRFNDMESVRTSNFDPTRLTKIVIHGWADGASEFQIGTWILEMRDAYLRLADVNYIAIDYAVLASFYLYFTAVPEMVGQRLGEMITFMHEKHDMPLDPLHLIGWSWGAQIAGFAGHQLHGKIGRITGIDPAGPTFKFVDDEFRLDKKDAKFVDIIHVNGGKLLFWGYYGLEDSIGHVDVFPNGGRKQIGCPVERTLIYETLWCSHGRGVRYFTESITSPLAFPSCLCEDFDRFVRGECACDNATNIYMGEHLSIHSPQGNYYLTTKAKQPYGHGPALNVSLVSDIKDYAKNSLLTPKLAASVDYLNGTTEHFLIRNTFNTLSTNYPNDDILKLSLALMRSEVNTLPNVEKTENWRSDNNSTRVHDKEKFSLFDGGNMTKTEAGINSTANLELRAGANQTVIKDNERKERNVSTTELTVTTS